MKSIQLTMLVSLLTFFTALAQVHGAHQPNSHALSLDGDGDWVEFIGTGVPTGNDSFTIGAWIQPESIPTGGANGGTMTFWGNQAGNQANGFRLRGDSGVRHYFWGNDHDENMGSSVLPETTGPNGDGWHHFAITYDGAQTAWYWNGAPLGNPRAVSNLTVADANYRIGSRLDAEYFHGHIDEVSIWNHWLARIKRRSENSISHQNRTRPTST